MGGVVIARSDHKDHFAGNNLNVFKHCFIVYALKIVS